MNKEDVKIGDFVFTKLKDDYYIGIVESLELNLIWCKWKNAGKNISVITINDFYEIKPDIPKITPLESDIVHKFLENTNDINFLRTNCKNIKNKSYYIGINYSKEYNEELKQNQEHEKEIKLNDLKSLIDLSLALYNKGMFNEYSNEYNKLKNK